MARELDPLAGASAADALAEQIALQRVDEAGATPQPSSVAKLWVSPEYDELRTEQHSLHDAVGVEQSREATVEGGGRYPPPPPAPGGRGPPGAPPPPPRGGPRPGGGGGRKTGGEGGGG